REQRLVSGEAIPRWHRRERDETAIKRDGIDPSGGSQVHRQERDAVARIDVLDADQVPVTPDLLDHRYAPKGIGQLIAEPRPAFTDVIDPAFFSKHVDNRQSYRARHRRP